MARFDRYLLSQLMMLFGFFALVLVAVYWVNRAVSLFDQLIADGQSAWVFLEFTALTLPNVIRIVLPIAAFAASVYTTNRLTSESELVVVQATGFSAFRLARPVLLFGCVVALLVSVLTHYLVPSSVANLQDRRGEIAQNVTARLLTEGSFLHPAQGVTFYIREISPQGELRDVFLSDARDTASQTTYTAKRALIVRSDNGPKLVMFEGMAQNVRGASNRLSTTRFEDFAYDIGGFIDKDTERPRNLAQLSTSELFAMDPDTIEETGKNKASFVEEAHSRFTQALLAIVGALIGFSALLMGNFSRFGVWRQIVIAVLLLILVKVIEGAVTDIVLDNANRWPLLYLPFLFGLSLSATMLWISSRPALFVRRRAIAP